MFSFSVSSEMCCGATSNGNNNNQHQQEQGTRFFTHFVPSSRCLCHGMASNKWLADWLMASRGLTVEGKVNGEGGIFYNGPFVPWVNRINSSCEYNYLGLLLFSSVQEWSGVEPSLRVVCAWEFYDSHNTPFDTNIRVKLSELLNPSLIPSILSLLRPYFCPYIDDRLVIVQETRA